MRVLLPGLLLFSVGQVRINFSSFGETSQSFYSKIGRSGKWKKVRYGNGSATFVRLKTINI
jgi:hypothetical protein